MTDRDLAKRAEHVLDEHTEPAHGRKYTDRADERDVAALRAEQRDEAAGSWVGPGVPAMTAGQTRGFLFGSLAGGAIGAIVFLPLALIPFMDPAWGRVLLVVIAGALAGGTAGALYFGGREPELEGETIDADGRPSIGTTLRDPHSDRRGR